MIIENVGYIHDDLLGGTRPMTHFEFMQTCTEEEMAEEIYKCIMSSLSFNFGKVGIEKWLKEKHTNGNDG